MKELEFDIQLANHDETGSCGGGRTDPQGSVFRMIVLLDGGEDEGWSQLSLDRLGAAYSEEDAVYEKLKYGPPA